MENTPKRSLHTPPTQKRAKRIPKVLWGSAEAKARKTELAAERQRKRRERLREEARRRWRERDSTSSSDEGEPQETPLPREDSDNENNEDEAGQRGELGEVPAVDNVLPGDDAIYSSRFTESLQQATNNRTQRELFLPRADEEVATAGSTGAASARHGRDELTEELQDLSRELAKIKISSNISDSAMDKLMRLFANKREAYGKLLDDGVITGSYTRSVKPKLISTLPKFNITILLKENDTTRGYHYKKIEGLDCIPQEYLTLSASGPTTLLRTECSVNFSDVKELYLETHGGRTAANLQQLQDISLSCDGVRESKSGSTTFIIVTARIGTCIYLLHIFDVLIGVPESKPSPKEQLW